MDLLAPAFEALGIIADPMRLLILFGGVALGLFIGVVPGIGGLVGMALLLPFTYAMDPYAAMAFLIGMWSVTPTADTIPSIMLGVPGGAGSAATVMDGYPMARRGEAARALGASYTASVLGGLFGAILLGISIPVLRPFMLAFGTPELLALCVLGLMLVAAVSQGQILKGLVAAAFGVILASVGDESQTGTLRWTFDTLYLWEGLPIVALVLGLFAIPEIIDVGASKQSIAGDQAKISKGGQMQGVRDALRNWKIVLNSSWLGSVLGAVPGLGGATIDWIAYGSAARAVKDGQKTFGTGDVRGVIAAEAANNSKEGGALVPTIAFGIPGSATMAILLGAFIMHGIQPGPKLLSENLDITYTIVWTLVIGNILGAAICFAFVSQLAKLALIPAGILVPTVMAIIFIGAYQATRDIGDLIVLLGAGIVGWVMKRFGWPRAALLLGVVLGGLVEQYLFISTSRYGFDWLQRPGVIVIFMIPVVYLIFRLYQFLRDLYRKKATVVAPAVASGAGVAAADPVETLSPVDRFAVPAIWVAMALFFGLAFLTSADWRFAAKLMPQTVAAAALIFIVCMAIATFLKIRNGVPITAVKRNPNSDALAGMPEGEAYRRVGIMALYPLVLFGGTLLIGLLPSMLLYMPFFMRVEGKLSWKRALLISVPMWIAIFVLFDVLLNVPWPQSLLGDTFPMLRRQLSGII
ncbi:MAG: tripartite tricarboxylate transporter permease [Devosia sp.]